MISALEELVDLLIAIQNKDIENSEIDRAQPLLLSDVYKQVKNPIMTDMQRFLSCMRYLAEACR